MVNRKDPFSIKNLVHYSLYWYIRARKFNGTDKIPELISPRTTLVRRLSQRDEAMSRLITESWANFVATVSILIFIIKFIIIVHFDIITIYTIASANFVFSIMMIITLSC